MSISERTVSSWSRHSRTGGAGFVQGSSSAATCDSLSTTPQLLSTDWLLGAPGTWRPLTSSKICRVAFRPVLHHLRITTPLAPFPSCLLATSVPRTLWNVAVPSRKPAPWATLHRSRFQLGAYTT